MKMGGTFCPHAFLPSTTKPVPWNLRSVPAASMASSSGDQMRQGKSRTDRRSRRPSNGSISDQASVFRWTSMSPQSEADSNTLPNPMWPNRQCQRRSSLWLAVMLDGSTFAEKGLVASF